MMGLVFCVDPLTLLLSLTPASINLHNDAACGYRRCLRDEEMNGCCWSSQTLTAEASHARKMDEHEEIRVSELLNMKLNMKVSHKWSVFRDMSEVFLDYDSFLICNNNYSVYLYKNRAIVFKWTRNYSLGSVGTSVWGFEYAANNCMNLSSHFTSIMCHKTISLHGRIWNHYETAARGSSLWMSIIKSSFSMYACDLTSGIKTE